MFEITMSKPFRYFFKPRSILELLCFYAVNQNDGVIHRLRGPSQAVREVTLSPEGQDLSA